MKRLILIRSGSVGGLALGLVSTFWFHILPLRAQLSEVHPFTATIIDSHYSPGSSEPKASETYVVAMRADGVEVTIRSSQFQGKTYERSQIFNPIAKTRVSVEPITRSRTTYYLPNPAVSGLLSVREACSQANDLPVSTTLGARAVLMKSSAHDPMARVDQWQAPDLGCLVLRETWHQQDPATGIVYNYRVIAATQLRRGDPDPALFEIGADFVERSPSQVMRIMAQLRHYHFDSQTGARLDRAYFNNRPK